MRIRQYTWVAVCSFKRQSAFRFHNIMSVISSVIFVTIVYFMWSAVYREGGNFSMTLQETLTYTVIITVINKVITGDAEMDVGDRVNTGAIGSELVRPLSFFWYLFAQKLGTVLFQFLFASIPLMLIAILFLHITVLESWIAWIYFTISLLLSMLLIYVFEFAIGLFSFLTAQIYGVSLLKQVLVGVLAGMTIPLSFYPDFLRNICINLPFQAMYYIPSTIWLGYGTEVSFLQERILSLTGCGWHLSLLLEQCIWLIILGGATSLLWSGIQKKLVIQGG